jgi:hypothetical protein
MRWRDSQCGLWQPADYLMGAKSSIWPTTREQGPLVRRAGLDSSGARGRRVHANILSALDVMTISCSRCFDPRPHVF